MSKCVVVFLLLVMAVAGRVSLQGQAAPRRAESASGGSGRHLVPQRWWEKAAASCGMTIKEPIRRQAGSAQAAAPFYLLKDLAQAGALLDELKAHGCSVIALGDPAETAGRVYPGLATKDHYRLPAEAGTIDDFRRFVALAHSKGLPVTITYNLGYSSLEADHFLKACDDVRAGRDTKEARWFIWSDRADSPPPLVTTNIYFMLRPKHLPPAWIKSEIWQYSERAGRYYWTKWSGEVDGKMVHLPQYNWGSQEFQEEAERIVRFWMDTGIDGMMQDAVNWYVGYSWELGRRRITDVIESYGNTWRLPEGGGGFHEDPVPWITEGNWNALIDYSLGIWWEKTNTIVDCINSGDPRPLERALRAYRDRVVAEGGVLSAIGGRMDLSKEPEKERLAMAILATIGEIFPARGRGAADRLPNEETVWLIKTKARRASLHNNSTRRQLPTRADDKHYAVLRIAADKSERTLVVMNFQPTAQTVEVDLSGVATAGLVELKSGQALPREYPVFRVELPAYGYRLYDVKPAVRLP